jgi:hypothetical protein
LTVGALAVGMSIAGCSSQSNDVVVDMGEKYVKGVSTAELTPGDAPAMEQLAAEIRSSPKAETYTIKWKNSFATGPSFSRELDYDHKAGSLIDDSNGVPREYSGVTDDMIFALAKQHTTADALPTVGAKYVPPK